MKWVELKAADASQKFDEFCKTKRVECPPAYIDLRKDLLQLFNKTLTDIGITKETISQKNNSYMIDLYFGIGMYELLADNYGFSVRKASIPGLWRQLCTAVVPDLVDIRYGTSHPDRFWKKPKRIWLRTIWWYIYLSWQGSREKTIQALKDNTTDEILQLVDRAGRGGYRVGLYRTIMRKYSSVPKSQRTKNKMFRRLMVLNTARVQVIEPGLYTGGEKEYVDSLCEYFMKN